MDSPLDPDSPIATYRVSCPVCRQNVWAGDEPPPAEGEEILAEHDCPGPDATPPVQSRALQAVPEPVEEPTGTPVPSPESRDTERRSSRPAPRATPRP